MPRILWHPQLSMRSYSRGGESWLLNRDSQLNRAIDWIEALPQDWEFTMILPGLGMVAGSHPELPTNVEVVTTHQWAPNALLGRYNFPVSYAIETLKSVKPDLIFCEVPELVRNWRAVQAHIGDECPIATLVIHLADGMSDDYDYTIRQLDGVLAADLAAFQLPGTRAEFLAKTKGWLLNELGGFDAITMEHLWKRWRVWPALFRMSGMPKPQGLLNLPGIRDVAFTARLSDNDRTHHREFFEAVRIIQGQGRDDIRFWFLNPNEAMTQDQVWKATTAPSSTYTTKLHVGPYERAAYFNILWTSEVVPILWPQSSIHSRGFCEAIAADNLIVHPGDMGMPVATACEPSDPASIARAVLTSLDMSALSREQVLLAQRGLLELRSVENNIETVRKDLAGLMGI